jgi:hypothetical protein
MTKTIANMLVCGLVVDHGPKRPDASKGKPPCREPIYLKEPRREGHLSIMSCSGSSSGSQLREGTELIIIDGHVLNDPKSAGMPGGTNAGQK